MEKEISWELLMQYNVLRPSFRYGRVRKDEQNYQSGVQFIINLYQ